MKKICFITTISLTLRVFVLKTAEYIHNNTDWEISFICNNDDEFKKMLPDYINYIPVEMDRGISASGFKAVLEMIKIFKREQYDLIQYSTPNASLYASLAGIIAGVPVRLYCQWGMAYVGFRGMKRKVFKAEEKFVCFLSTNIEPDSNSNLTFSHTERLYPESKGSVIWNGSACGIDINKFDISNKQKYRRLIREQYQISDDSFVYGFVGRITRDKGINELFSAFKQMKSSHAYLILVGPEEIDDTIKPELMAWAKDNEHVIFTGYTNKVEQYLSAMDCYVLPSYREGFGMGVVEAEVMGVPVIVTDIPGPVDAMIPEKTGIIIQKGNTEQLRDAMKKMYNMGDNIKIMEATAHEFARNNFNQKIFMRKLLEDRFKLMGA